MIRCADNIRLKILTYMCIHVYVKKQIGGGGLGLFMEWPGGRHVKDTIRNILFFLQSGPQFGTDHQEL